MTGPSQRQRVPRSWDVRALAAAVLAAALPIAAPAQTASQQSAPAPTRTLVYAYESRAGAAGNGPDNGGYGDPFGSISPDDCLTGGMKVAGRMSSGIDAGNGGIDWFQVDCHGGFGYKVGANQQPDRGSITVGMLGKQSDGSLVVQLSEAPPQGAPSSITCVVFATTAIICDPNKPVSLEEVTLMRFLAPGIVNPDRNQTQWQLQDGDAQTSFKATFAVKQDAAGVMTIDERRSAKGEAGPNSTDESVSSFTYDIARAVPTAIVERFVQKTVRYGQYRTMQRDTIFQLLPPPSR